MRVRRLPTRWAAVLGMLVIVGAALATAWSSQVIAGSGQVELHVLLGGRGSVAVSGPGGTRICELGMQQADQGCRFDYPRASMVTLAATPAAGGSSFSTWGVAECAGQGPCGLRLDDDVDVVATFSPLQLEVFVDGEGTVTPSPAPLGTCSGSTSLCWLYPAGTEVTLTAEPTNGASTRWLEFYWCEPDAGDRTSPVCRTRVAFTPHYVAVHFGDGPSQYDGFPFGVSVVVRVLTGGTGRGTVTGSGIDCGTSCRVSLNYQASISLQAIPEPGSRFVRWEGVCGTQPSCRFLAGPVTSVRAVFDRVPSTTTGNTTTGGTTTTPLPPVRPLRAVLGRLALGRGAGAVAVPLVVSAPGRARARLLRKGRVVVARTFVLRKGRNVLRIPIPRRARSGKLTLKIVVTDAGGRQRRLTRTLRLPPRRG